MDLPFRFGLLSSQVMEYLRENVEPHLTELERLAYERDHRMRITFDTTTSLNPGSHTLVRFPTLDTAMVLDAIVVQAIFGRNAMMRSGWFRLVYSRYAARLDSLPREMIHELRQMRTEFYGEQADFSPPANMPTTVENNGPLLTPTVSVTRSNIAEDILALLNKQNEETIDLDKKHQAELDKQEKETTELDMKHEAELDKQKKETTELDEKHEAELDKQEKETTKLDKKHEAELRKRFDTAVEKFPGLSGVLCGVQHSFRDRADRSAERKALINATMEYIARNGL